MRNNRLWIRIVLIVAAHVGLSTTVPNDWISQRGEELVSVGEYDVELTSNNGMHAIAMREYGDEGEVWITVVVVYNGHVHAIEYSDLDVLEENMCHVDMDRWECENACVDFSKDNTATRKHVAYYSGDGLEPEHEPCVAFQSGVPPV